MPPKRKYTRKPSKRSLIRKYKTTPFHGNKAASTIQAAVRRALFKNAESKNTQSSANDNQAVGHNSFINVSPNNILYTTQGAADPENTNIQNRIGDKITLTKVECRGMFELDGRYTDVSYRIMVVKSAKGDTPTSATMFMGISGNKMLDNFNYERYSIIYQKWGKIKATNTGGADYIGGVGYVGSGLLTVNSGSTLTQSRATKIIKFSIPVSKFSKDGVIQYEANNSAQQKFFDYNIFVYAYSNYATSEGLGWNVMWVNDFFTRLTYKDF